MSEQELFDELCIYFSGKRTVHEGEKRCYMIIEVYESDTDIGSTSRIIDPGMPAKMTKEQFFELTLPQQIMHRATSEMRKSLKEIAEHFTKIAQVANAIDMPVPEMMRLADKAKTPEDFTKLMMRGLKNVNKSR